MYRCFAQSARFWNAVICMLFDVTVLMRVPVGMSLLRICGTMRMSRIIVAMKIRRALCSLLFQIRVRLVAARMRMLDARRKPCCGQ